MEFSKVKERIIKPNPDPPPKPVIGKWIKLRSRTHQDRPFYWNKVTGSSVWHLTEDEFARAHKYETNGIREPEKIDTETTIKPPEMKTTKDLKALKMHETLEPKEPVTEMTIPPGKIKPKEPVTEMTIPPEKINAKFARAQKYDNYEIQEIRDSKRACAETITPPETRITKETYFKRQLINDQVEQAIPQSSKTLLAANPNPNCSQQYHIIPPFDPRKPPPVTPLPGYVVIPQYPPHLLQIPLLNCPQTLPYYPHQQISASNFTHPNSILTKPTNMSNRFKSLAKKRQLLKINPVVVSNNNKRAHNLRPHLFNDFPSRIPQRYLRNDGIKDLRELIQAKRSTNTKKVTSRTDDKFISEDEPNRKHVNAERDIENQMKYINADGMATNECDETELIYSNDSDDQSETELLSIDDVAKMNIEYTKWLQEINNADGEQSKMFLKPIMLRLGCSDEEIWYVVADTNVFLSNRYFLDIFVNSEEHCRILLPSRVLTELEGLTGNRKSEAIQQAAWDAIEFLDKSPRVVTEDTLFSDIQANQGFATGDDEILDCIRRLTRHNFRVLVLSNDVLLLRKSKILKALSFTVPALKKFLFSSNIVAEAKAPFMITIHNTLESSSYGVAKYTVPEAANNNTEIAPTSVSNIANSDGQKDFGLKQINNKISNTKTLVDKDVLARDEYCADDNSNTEPTSNITTKVNAEIANDSENVSRKIRRSKWWSRRRKQKTTPDAVSTLTDSVTLTKSDEVQAKAKSLQNSPKVVGNQLNTAQEQSIADSDDSFSLNKRFSGSYLIPNSSQRQPRIVEESPTNSIDAISSTRSSVFSFNNIIECLDINFDGDIDKGLFDVSDKAIEGRLKTGAEEWTSRFLQIMEEVLTQVLRQNPLVNNPYEPPWTIHEATECLKKKYHNNTAIVNAATKLSFTIFSSSDKMGHVFRTLCPKRFMKLFSHGWHLVVVLLQVLSGRLGSEELILAKDSLTKLLSDIKGLSDTTDHFLDDSECVKDNNMDTLELEPMDMDIQGDTFQHYESAQPRSPILQNTNKDPVLSGCLSFEYAKAKKNIRKSALIQSINTYNSTNQFDQDEFTQNVPEIHSPDYPPPEGISQTAEDGTYSPKTPDTTSSTEKSQKVIRNFKIDAKYENRIKINCEMVSFKNTPPEETNISPADEKIKRNLKKFAEFERMLFSDHDDFGMYMYSSNTNENPVVNRNFKFAELEKRTLEKDSAQLNIKKPFSATTSVENENPVIKLNFRPIPEFDKRTKRKDNERLNLNKISSTANLTKNANTVRKTNLKTNTEFEKTITRKDNDKLDLNKLFSTTTSTNNEIATITNRNLAKETRRNLENNIIRKDEDINKHPSTTTANPLGGKNIHTIAKYEKRINNNKNNDMLDINKSYFNTTSTTKENTVMKKDVKNVEVLENKIIRKATLNRAICLKPSRSNVDMDMLSYSEDECDMDDLDDDKYNYYGNDNIPEAIEEQPKTTIKSFFAEINDTFQHVHSYCEQTYLEFSNDKIINSERKVELIEQTEDMHAYLNSLLSSLNSILLRENTSVVNTQQFRLGSFKNSQCSTYSVIIEKCRAQVKILLDVLSSLIRDLRL